MYTYCIHDTEIISCAIQGGGGYFVNRDVHMHTLYYSNLDILFLTNIMELIMNLCQPHTATVRAKASVCI